MINEARAMSSCKEWSEVLVLTSTFHRWCCYLIFRWCHCSRGSFLQLINLKRKEKVDMATSRACHVMSIPSNTVGPFSAIRCQKFKGAKKLRSTPTIFSLRVKPTHCFLFLVCPNQCKILWTKQTNKQLHSSQAKSASSRIGYIFHCCKHHFFSVFNSPGFRFLYLFVFIKRKLVKVWCSSNICLRFLRQCDSL